MARRFGTRRALLGSQALWTPAQLSSLTAWWDAQTTTTLFQDSALTTPAGNGDVVGGWVDRSGNGYTLTQATTANKPTMTASVINGIAAPHFDGGDFIGSATLGTLFSGSDIPFSIWIVAKQDNTGGIHGAWTIHRAADNNPIHCLQLRATAGYRSERRDDALGTSNQTGGTDDTSAHIIGLVFPGTTVSVYIDRTAVISAQAHDVGTITLDSFTLGARMQGISAGSQFLGPIGEAILANAALTDSQRSLLDTYLSNKWGITIA